MNSVKRWFSKTENIFLIVGGVFGLISIFFNPILVVPDETTHLAFSYSMFSCNAHVPTSLHISEDHIEIPKDIRQHRYLEDFTKRVNLDGNCFTVNVKEKKSNMLFGNNQAVTGSVIEHAENIPAAIGILIGRAVWPTVGGMVLLGRLTNFVVFLVAIYFIIKKVKFGKLAFLFLAITPMMIQQMASLSYDVFNLVATFTFVAFCINLAVQKNKLTRKQYLEAAGVVVLLFFSKQNNLVMLPLLIGIITAKYRHPFMGKTKQHIASFKNRLGSKGFRMLEAGIGFVSLAAVGLIFREVLNLHRVKDTFLNTLLNPNVNGQIDPIATTGVVGNFGWLAYRLPEWLVALWFVVLTIVLLGSKAPVLSRRLSAWTFVIFVLVCASVFGALGYDQYIHGNNVLLGIQGRYFTPLFALLILVFAGLQRDIKVVISPKKLKILAVSFSICLLLVYLWQTKVHYY